MAKKQESIDALLEKETIIDTDVTSEMKNSYLIYALMTISDRALPDVRDGLKPVQRMILYSMYRNHIFPESTTKKSARIVGDVIGKYHPHGDQACYGALTNLVNDFDMRYPFIEGQGNFGSADGDSPAAMRYTEAKLRKIAIYMLNDIQNNGVNMFPNYSEDDVVPEVLPSALPNLLVNGTTGIAVGYTTETPSHNLKEVANAIIAQIKNPDITIEKLMKYIKGPDLPSGALLINDENIKILYETGEASLNFRGKVTTEINPENNNKQVVITELPPGVKKPTYVEKLYNTYVVNKDKKVVDVRDESEQNLTRIVLELHKTAVPELIIKDLYANTQLSKSKKYYLRAIVDKTPMLLNLKQIIYYYIEHRRSVIQRRTEFILEKLRKEYNRKNGLCIIWGDLSKPDIVNKRMKKLVNIICDSSSKQDAAEKIKATYNLDDEQTDYILEKKLSSLTNMEKQKTVDEVMEIKNQIQNNTNILSAEDNIDNVIIQELEELKEKFGDKRKTEIVDLETYIEQAEQTTVSDEVMFIGLDNKYQIKYMPFTIFEKMLKNSCIKEKSSVFIQGLKCKMEDNFIVFFENGEYIKCNFHYLISNKFDNKVINIINNNEENNNKILVAITKKGLIKKMTIDAYKAKELKQTNFMKIEGNDNIIAIRVSDKDDNIITLITKNGIIHRFHQDGFSATSQTAKPLGCISLDDNDEITDFHLNKDEKDSKIILFGNKNQQSHCWISFNIDDFIIKNRMAKGKKAINNKKLEYSLDKFIILEKNKDSMLINENGDTFILSYKDIITSVINDKPSEYDKYPITSKFFI